MAQEITTKEFNKVVKAIEHNSSFDGEVLKLSKLLEIKPIYENDKIVGFDIYKYADEELMEDDNYDFDADFIGSVFM